MKKSGAEVERPDSIDGKCETDELLITLYRDLHSLAVRRFAKEKPGQTLQATALVHEVFVKLADSKQVWQNKAHFFGAAAETMRRILIEKARSKGRQKRGGDRLRVDIENVEPIDGSMNNAELLDLDEAIRLLEQHDPRASQVVKLRFFAGLTMKMVAEALHVSLATVENDWAYAKSWLKLQLD